MAKFYVGVVAVLLIIISYFYQITPTWSQSQEESAQKLEDIQKKISELENQLEQSKNQEKTLSSQLKFIDTQNQITQLKIAESKAQIVRLEQEITDLSTRIDKLTSTVDSLTQVLLNRIIQTYKYGNHSTIDLLFSSNGFSDWILRTKYLEVAQANDKKVLYQLQATKANYHDQRTDRETRQAEMEKLKKDLEVYQKQLDNQKQAKEELLRETQNNEANYQSKLAQLRADADSIRRALGGAGVKIGPVKRGDVIASVGMTGCTNGPHLHFEVMTNARVENNSVSGRESKVDPKPYLDSGQFEKPLSNYSGQKCGDTCHDGDISALFGASGSDYIKGFPPHTGLDIVDPVGTPIHAAADGIAYQFQDSGTCYLTGTAGKGVVVDHQNGTVTLYWHIP